MNASPFCCFRRRKFVLLILLIGILILLSISIYSSFPLYSIYREKISYQHFWANFNFSLTKNMTGVVSPRPPPFGVSTIMMCLLFGTNCFLFIFFQLLKYFNQKQISHDVADKKEHKKELSKPFTGTLDCYINLTSELFITGLIMAMTYICEFLWVFDHSSKSYSRDLFLFVLIIFFAYAIYTIRPVTDLTLLGREQTEEWKGWMQFIFLLYHYFHAEEVYNSVRVMISCYVWMTGFGNFSFFYIKQDFSWLRILQMLWRLNFSVLLLMWTHNNTYILYYICPMHTFYFLMVYATMGLFPSINATKWGIRWKLLALAFVIFIIWDVNGGIFDFLFAWLGTDKVIGANSGSVWEYYFRTSLDHWSTFLGMIFALNFPLAEQYFVKAKGWPLVVAGVLMGCLTIWWLVYCYSLDKLAYNLTHSYFTIIPLTSYIFFRNITPFVRSGVSMSLHDLGKTTLETYLLQHHIWLTSNAKTLWTIIPEHPWINFALATIIFFSVSKELYRLTMSLRGMILPDDKTIAITNSIGTIIIFFILWIVSQVLYSFNPTSLEIIIACLGLTVISFFLIRRYSPAIEHASYQTLSSNFLKFIVAGFFFVLLAQLIQGHPTISTELSSSVPKFIGNTPGCLEAVSNGHWISNPCDDVNAAYCNKNEWIWELPENCPIKKFTSAKAQVLLKGKKVTFIGDSVTRSSYHQIISLIEPGYSQNHSYSLKHQDFNFVTSFNTSINFVWSPFIGNASEHFVNFKPNSNLFVYGASLWDSLYSHDLEDYKNKFEAINSQLLSFRKNNNGSSPIFLWLLPTEILDDRLPSEEKRTHMNEKNIEKYRQIVKQTIAQKGSGFHTVIDPQSASLLRESTSMDGVHYGDEVYSVIGQMIINSYSLQFPNLYSKKSNNQPYKPKVTGSMSFPEYGVGMLILTIIMLFLMDSFLGIGYLSLTLFGRSYDWEGAYGPLHRKIFGTLPSTVQMQTIPNNDEHQGLLNESNEKSSET